MFEHIAVDGSTSCTPGEEFVTMEAEKEDGEDNDVEPHEENPMTSSSNRRGSAMNDSANSPTMKTKNPMVKAVRELVDSFKSSNTVVHKVMQGELRSASIKKAMQLAIESGATEGSVEIFVASQLFVIDENRDVFFSFTANEGRLNWLKRWCQEKNMWPL